MFITVVIAELHDSCYLIKITAKPKRGQQVVAQSSNQASPADIVPGMMMALFVIRYCLRLEKYWR
jgi:hypothetical protein